MNQLSQNFGAGQYTHISPDAHPLENADQALYLMLSNDKGYGKINQEMQRKGLWAFCSICEFELTISGKA